ncbi:hypothetical protein [Bradyrhizobium sp. Ce-3]|uniref:hypothetical protein n=1 Tax=Bradyrhizobium sp. Ce-3 TaxID=2913970 RepID=UPI001FC8D0BE|nr:hypothetical protein [Bradyrhizobium sp. Ce-3]
MVEVLAGSTALLANPVGSLTDLPLPATSVLPEDSPTDAAASQLAHGLIDALPAANVLESNASLLDDGPGGGAGSDLPVAGNLLNPSDLPIAGELLNAVLPAEPDPASALTASGGMLQSVLDTAGTAVQSGVHSAADVLPQATALPDALHGITNLGQAIDLGSIGTIGANGGHANLVADILDVPGQILAGNLGETIAHLGADISDIVHVVSGLVDTVVSDVSGLLSPVSGLVNQLSHGLLDSGLLNLGGDATTGGGLLGGLLGGLTGSGSGQLAGGNIGPVQTNGPTPDILAAPTSGDHHTVDTGQTGPHLLDLGALTSSHGLNIPSLGGVGADGLAGNLLGSLNLNLLGDSSASGPAASAPVAAPLDLDAVAHDLLSPLTHGHGILDAHGTHIL